MNSYTRHFVSQHFGKATATVSFDNSVGGHVSIEVPALPEKNIKFSFKTARLEEAMPDRESWGEMVARIAIHQLHQRLAGKAERADPADHELAMDTTRWNGDLEHEAYGGATDGYPARVK